MSSISAPTQAKLLAVDGADKPEPVGVLEETALSSSDVQVTSAADDNFDADDVIFVAPVAAAQLATNVTRTGAEVAAAAVVVAHPVAVEQANARAGVAAGNGAVLAELSATKRDARSALIDGDIKVVSAAMSRYDELVVALMLRVTMPLPPTMTAPSATPSLRSPAPQYLVRETWSCVVKGVDPELSSRQIPEKVRKEVAPALGVRVHEVRELKRGGAIIRTPSSSKACKVAASKKFAEVGLSCDTGRWYIKWFSFRCWSQVRTYTCHLCVGFDHKVQDCRIRVLTGWGPLCFSKLSRHAPGHLNYARRETLTEWVITQEMQVVNEPSEWFTFNGPMGRSDIDVTLVNESAMRVCVFQWSVLGGHGVSDNNPIEIVVTHNMALDANAVVNGLRYGGANWALHGHCVREAATQVPFSTFCAMNVDEQVACVTEWVTSANDIMFARHRKVTRKRVKWWTRDLKAQLRSLRSLLKKVQRARRSDAEGLAQLRDQYSTWTHEYKHNACERGWWRTFVERNKLDPWGRVFKILQECDRNRDRGVCALQDGGRVLTTGNDCEECLLSEFFPREDQQHSVPDAVGVADPLLVSELEWGLTKLRSGKAPGMDGFTAEICRSVWKAIPDHLYELHAKCVSEGVFPSAWKRTRVSVLLKSPDRVRSNPRSFLGISLVPVLAKVLERVLVERLQESVGSQMSDRQFGFREGKSVEDAWMYVKYSVRSSSSKYVLGVFVDFKEA
ncbi:hypothetical protein KR074_003896 [Drosophila pseudoananassae]|nr:hypothetical protein KR074_003896 [Drosophila pseudoananassae]